MTPKQKRALVGVALVSLSSLLLVLAPGVRCEVDEGLIHDLIPDESEDSSESGSEPTPASSDASSDASSGAERAPDLGSLEPSASSDSGSSGA